MHTFQTPLTPGRVDRAAATIYGVSVCSLGVAKGHGLIVDGTTLDQMQACAQAKGQIPVKVDHKSGAAAVCGYLTNFRHTGMKLVSDLHLLRTHPLCDQIIETAERMPSGVGLSAAFVGDDSEPGRARCKELLSVDLVNSPASNPTGLFARPERPDGLERAGRVLDSGKTAAEVAGIAAGAGFVARRLMKTKRLPRISSPSFKKGLASAVGKGAIVGGLAGGLYRAHRDQVEARRFERQAIREILFEKPTIRRVTDAASSEVAKNVDIPGAAEIQAATQAAKNRRVRSILWRGSKIAAGATLGHLAGKKLGARAGLYAGAAIGTLLERNFETMNTDKTHRRLVQLVEANSTPIRVNRTESHTIPSLAKRIGCSEEVAAKLIETGVIEPIGDLYKNQPEGGPRSFHSNQLNSAAKMIVEAIIDRAVEESDAQDEDGLVAGAADAVRRHKASLTKPAPGDTQQKEFSRRISAHGTFMLAQPEEERPGLLRKAAGVAAVGAGLWTGAAALRGAKSGRSILEAAVAGHRANLGTLKKVGAAVRPGLSAATERVLKAAGYHRA